MESYDPCSLPQEAGQGVIVVVDLIIMMGEIINYRLKHTFGFLAYVCIKIQFSHLCLKNILLVFFVNTVNFI